MMFVAFEIAGKKQDAAFIIAHNLCSFKMRITKRNGQRVL